jgi:plastocyanin
MSSLRTHLHTLALVAAVFTATAVNGARAHAAQSSAPAGAVAIEIDNFKFGVVSIVVAKGTIVTWTNHDDVPHTVVSSTKLFKSPPLDTDQKFSYTFNDVGTFEYYCSLHPRMTGTIVVK